MKTKIKNMTIVFLTTILIAGCDPADVATPCDNTNTAFKQLYNQTVAITMPIPNQDVVTYDSEIHSYTFEVDSQKSICSVGYQSQPALSTTPYLIEIWDETPTTPVLIGSLSSVFSSTTTSYASFASPIHLAVGNSYRIKRIQTTWGSSIGNTIGRMVNTSTGAPLTFPYTFGTLKITGSSLYQNAGTQNDWAIPYIEIVFL
jgi:hypothetical protein